MLLSAEDQYTLQVIHTILMSGKPEYAEQKQKFDRCVHSTLKRNNEQIALQRKHPEDFRLLKEGHPSNVAQQAVLNPLKIFGLPMLPAPSPRRGEKPDPAMAIQTAITSYRANNELVDIAILAHTFQLAVAFVSLRPTESPHYYLILNILPFDDSTMLNRIKLAIKIKLDPTHTDENPCYNYLTTLYKCKLIVFSSSAPDTLPIDISLQNKLYSNEQHVVTSYSRPVSFIETQTSIASPDYNFNMVFSPFYCGQPLSAIIANPDRKLTFSQTLELILLITHEYYCVHSRTFQIKDCKPENILVHITDEGKIFVMLIDLEQCPTLGAGHTRIGTNMSHAARHASDLGTEDAETVATPSRPMPMEKFDNPDSNAAKMLPLIPQHLILSKRLTQCLRCRLDITEANKDSFSPQQVREAIMPVQLTSLDSPDIKYDLHSLAFIMLDLVLKLIDKNIESFMRETNLSDQWKRYRSKSNLFSGATPFNKKQFVNVTLPQHIMKLQHPLIERLGIKPTVISLLLFLICEMLAQPEYIRSQPGSGLDKVYNTPQVFQQLLDIAASMKINITEFSFDKPLSATYNINHFL